MRHHLNLDLADHQPREKVVGLRRVTLRERLARLILGGSRTFTVVIPGDSVDQVTITQHSDEDNDLMALSEAVGVSARGDAALMSPKPTAISRRRIGSRRGSRCWRLRSKRPRGSRSRITQVCRVLVRSPQPSSPSLRWRQPPKSTKPPTSPGTGSDSGGCACVVGAGPHGSGALVTGRPYRAGS